MAGTTRQPARGPAWPVHQPLPDEGQAGLTAAATGAPALPWRRRRALRGRGGGHPQGLDECAVGRRCGGAQRTSSRSGHSSRGGRRRATLPRRPMRRRCAPLPDHGTQRSPLVARRHQHCAVLASANVGPGRRGAGVMNSPCRLQHKCQRESSWPVAVHPTGRAALPTRRASWQSRPTAPRARRPSPGHHPRCARQCPDTSRRRPRSPHQNRAPVPR